MAVTQSPFGMAHYTVVPENFDPDRDGDGTLGERGEEHDET